MPPGFYRIAAVYGSGFLIGIALILFPSAGPLLTDPARPFVVPQTLNVRHGLFIVENLNLAELAAARVVEFMLVLTHARVRGATGAWVAPVAIV